MLALRGFLNGFFSASKISSDNSTKLEKALKELKLVFQHAKKNKDVQNEPTREDTSKHFVTEKAPFTNKWSAW